MTPSHRIKAVGARRLLFICGGILAAVLALLAMIFGPAVLGYLRFVRSVDSASQYDATTAGAWPQLSQACVACHGYGGNPANQAYARLAGQPEAYLVRQLTAFAAEERHSPVMSPLALSLSAADIKRLAGYFATQAVTPNTGLTVDPVRVKKGEALVRAGGCAACHGERLAGQEVNPRLAGQGDVYLARQLADFKSGARPDPMNAMKAVVAGMSESDMQNAAHYLATYSVGAK